MAQYVEGNLRSFPAGTTAIPQFSRVIMSGGVIVEAGAGDVELGTVEYQQFATNFLVDLPVRLRTAAGTVKMVAAGAITLYAPVYGAASGQVSATANKNFIGFALNATTGANSILEVLRAQTAFSEGGQFAVEVHTANYTVTSADSGKRFTTTGAAGEVDFTVPPSAVGLEYEFYCDTTNLMKVIPTAANGDKFGTPSTSTVPATGVLGTSNKGVSATAVGAYLRLACLSVGEWNVLASTGNWTTGV